MKTLASLTLFLATSLLAVDQRITIDATPKPFTVPKTCGPTKTEPCIGPKNPNDPSDAATLRVAD